MNDVQKLNEYYLESSKSLSALAVEISVSRGVLEGYLKGRKTHPHNMRRINTYVKNHMGEINAAICK